MEEHRKMLQKVVKRDQKRRKRIEAAGIEYECPELVSFRLHNSTFSTLRIELRTNNCMFCVASSGWKYSASPEEDQV